MQRDLAGEALQVEPAIPEVRALDELRFHRLLEKLPAGAYTCDADGLITYFNPHAVRIWGRAPQLRHPLDRFCGSFKLFTVDGRPLDHAECWMALALRERREFNGYEIVIEQPTGDRCTALAHANPIFDPDGTLLGAVNVLVDITDRTRAEAERAEANRRKDDFLAMLAHELRNPLAPISTSVEVLRRSAELPPELRRTLAVIDRQTRHMARLVDDLMDVARIARNKLELRIERLELHDVLDAAVECSRPLIEANAHALVVTAPREPLWLDADRTRLPQVISNLLNNAAKYTEPGGRIELHVRRDGAMTHVSVRDNGRGIAPDVLPHVFDLFVQGEGSCPRPDGLGLGLTLVRRLVELHGGAATAHSAGPGRGSEFVVTLPTREAPARATGPEAARGTATAAGDARRASVLVVEDNADAAESLSVMLELMGHPVRTAADGTEALRVAEDFRPDVVLLDIGLPDMSGHDVARELRCRPWGAALVLVALTGWGQDEDRRRSQAVGFDHHLVKPANVEALTAILCESGPRGGTVPDAH